MATTIELNMPNLSEKIKSRRDEIQRFIAAQIQFNRGMLFDNEGAYNGHPPWEPLKYREGQILSKRGTLRKSIAPNSADGNAGADGYVKIKPDSVTIGTNLYYAAMMNYGTKGLPGGVLKPVKAKALKIPTGPKSFIFRKSAYIPPRPFNELNEQDREEFEIALSNKLAELLNED